MNTLLLVICISGAAYFGYIHFFRKKATVYCKNCNFPTNLSRAEVYHKQSDQRPRKLSILCSGCGEVTMLESVSETGLNGSYDWLVDFDTKKKIYFR